MIKMRKYRSICIAAILGFAAAAGCEAQSLQVSPVIIDIPAPAASSLLTVMNSGSQSIVVQARVFRWTQIHGRDVLEKTGNVVVSPPFTTVKPGGRHVVRVIRISTDEISGEETYRILLDEAPGRQRTVSGAVALVVRHSVPVFFLHPEARQGALRWTAARSGGALLVHAMNPGQRRIKLTSLRVTDDKARVVFTVSGLAGYVLSGQTKTWSVKAPQTGLPAGASLSIDAMSETGAVHAVAALAQNN